MAREGSSISRIAEELEKPYTMVRRRLITLGLHKPLALPPSERTVLRLFGEMPEIPKEMTVGAACLAFAMLADYSGTVTGENYELGLWAGNDEDFARQFAELANREFKIHYVKAKLTEDGWRVRFGYTPLWEWYWEHFTFGTHGWEIKTKTMEWLKQRIPEELGRVLSWYFEGDGTVHASKPKCVYATSTNEKGLRQIKELTEELDIKTILLGPYQPGGKGASLRYLLYVLGKDNLRRYEKLIGFVSEEKLKKLHEITRTK